jgi:predicted dehydrogenase
VPFNWGIAGTGGIAASFAKALARVDDATLQAVSSRTSDRAAKFASEHGAASSYGSFAQMLADPAVDVVYVASPHTEHCRQALAAVQAGKHVLVEKPFGLSAAEAMTVFEAARSRGVFVMEALWSRFLPVHVELRRLVAAGEIGEVRSVEASFGGDAAQLGPSHRLLDPALGGGALLDLGIYPVNTAVQLLGRPAEVTSVAVLGETGVDVNTLVAMRFASGAVASAHCSLSATLPCTARVIGTTGTVELPSLHLAPDSLTIKRGQAEPEVVELPIGGDGLRYQVHEVHRCLAEGRQESDVMSWQHTLDLMSVLDQARACFGLRYPGEQ